SKEAIMYTLLPESQDALVALQVSGHLGEGDYREIIPLLETAIAENGKISLFWEMHDFEGWTASGLWADAKFDVKHTHDFVRVAFVGEKKWHQWMASFVRPFVSAEVRYFTHDEREKALAWAAGKATSTVR